MKDINWTHGALFFFGGAIIGFGAGVAAAPAVMDAIDGKPATPPLAAVR